MNTATEQPDARTDAPSPRVESIEVRTFTVPMEVEEADGTLRWDSTTAIVVLARSGEHEGLGYCYGDVAVAELIRSKLVDLIEGAAVMSPPASWAGMQRKLRNAGRPGWGRWRSARSTSLSGT